MFRKATYTRSLSDLELAVHEDLLAHFGTGKSPYSGHLDDLELAVH
jgi:hypothetical protein